MARHMKPIKPRTYLCTRLREVEAAGEASSADKNGLPLSPSFRILWKIIRDRIPRRAIRDERMKLRPNSGINIERSHPNRYLRAVRPIAAE